MAKVRTNPVSVKAKAQARKAKGNKAKPSAVANPLAQFAGPNNTFTGASWNQAKAAGYTDQQLQEYLSGKNKVNLGQRVQDVIRDFGSITSPAPNMPEGYDPRGEGKTISPSQASRPDIMFSPINIEGNKNMWGNPLSNRIVSSVVGDGKNWQDPANAAELATYYTPEARMKQFNATWAMSDMNPNLQQNMAAFIDSGHIESLITGRPPGEVNMYSAATPLSQAYADQLASSPSPATTTGTDAAATTSTTTPLVRNEPVRTGVKTKKTVFAGETGSEEGVIGKAKTFAQKKAGEIKQKAGAPFSGVVARAVADRGQTVTQKKDAVLKGTRQNMGISEQKRADFAQRSAESKKAKAAAPAPARQAPARQAPARQAPARQSAPAPRSASRPAPRPAPARQAQGRKQK